MKAEFRKKQSLGKTKAPKITESTAFLTQSHYNVGETPMDKNVAKEINTMNAQISTRTDYKTSPHWTSYSLGPDQTVDVEQDSPSLRVTNPLNDQFFSTQFQGTVGFDSLQTTIKKEMTEEEITKEGKIQNLLMTTNQ